MALTVRVGVDEKAAVAGVKKIGKSLEEVQDDFDQLARDGDRALDKVSDSAAKAGKEVKTKLSGGLKDAGKEANESGKEAAQSFSGGFDDVADFMQETLAQGLAGFGPIGAAAGIALAATLGAVLANATAAQEKLQEAREAARDLAVQMYENGGELPLEDAIDSLFDKLAQEIKPNGPIQSMIDSFVDFGSRVDAVKDAATDLNVPLQKVARALSGTDMKATEEILDKVNDRLSELKSNVSTAWVWDTAGLEDVKTQLETVIETKRVADSTLSVVGSSFESQAYRDKIAEIGQAWQDAATDAGDYITETDGITSFDWSAYLTNAETTLAAANDYKRRIVTLPDDIKGEAETIFAEQGAVAASSYISAYESASAADRGRFIAAAKANAEPAGAEAGAAMADEAERAAQAKAQGWGPMVMPATVKLNVDSSAWDNYVPRFKTGVIVANVQGREQV